MIDVMNVQDTEMITTMTRIQASMLAPAMSVHMQKGRKNETNAGAENRLYRL